MYLPTNSIYMHVAWSSKAYIYMENFTTVIHKVFCEVYNSHN